MNDLILIYTTWESVEQAKKAARHLLKKRLCGCVNILKVNKDYFDWIKGEVKK